MQVLTLDFETYYDREYSLRNMTTIEYIKDSRFEVIMMSYALDSNPVQNLIGEQYIRYFLRTLDWNNIIVNAQNTQFDGTILRERFGITAKFYADTMAMARVTGAHIFEGASLRAISNVLRKVGYPVPPKGTEVESAQGKHLQQFVSDYDSLYYLAEEETDVYDEVVRGETLLNAYVQYCNNDVELARQAFIYFSSMISADEMKYGDMILKTYIVPSTYLDLNIINTEIARIEQRDKERAQGIADTYFGGDMAQLRATCRSAKLFTAFLQAQGGVLASEVGMQPEEIIESGIGRFIIPERHSEKKGTVEPCYSKAFAGMMEMCDHPDPSIAELFQIKLDMTSSIEMSRALRFRNIAALRCGFGFPYVVSGAHTHRLGGAGKLNVQNLSSGRKAGQSKALKQSITAPPGYKIVVFDSSQIELRTGYYIAQEPRALAMFPAGKDPYSHLAAQIYGGDPAEIKLKAKQDIAPYVMYRQVGKSGELSCIYGTGKFGFQNYTKVNGLDLTEEQCQRVVEIYRQSHPEIVKSWKDCETALNQMMAGGDGYFGGPTGKLFYYTGNRMLHGERVPGIRLPDGNWLNYWNLRKEYRKMPDGSDKLNVAYTGMKEGKVKTIYTYPSKIFENCIAAGTEVLTNRGWIPIEAVQADDLVYDGEEFVSHEGLLYKGEQPCVILNGVMMTADHKVHTTQGWLQAAVVLQNNIPITAVKK